ELSIRKGRVGGVSFDAKLSLYKTDNMIHIPIGYFSFSETALQVSGFKYTLPNAPSKLEDYFKELVPGGKFSIENLLFFYNKAKFELRKVRYSVGDKKIVLFKGANSKNHKDKKPGIVLKDTDTGQDVKLLFKPLDLISNPNSMLTFDSGLISYKESAFEINKFKYKAGPNWLLDTDIRLRGHLLGNMYLANISLFGGRQNNKGELNIIARHLKVNEKLYDDVEMIVEKVNNKWTLWPNRLNINGFVSWDNKDVDYSLSYSGDATKLKSAGKLSPAKQNIDLDFYLHNTDLSISKIAPLLFKNAKGNVLSKLHFKGKWFDPAIQGFVKFKDVNFQMIDDVDESKTMNIDLEFNSKKKYRQSNVQYQHRINAVANYSQGLGEISGYFNLSYWNISDFIFDLKTPEKINVDIQNDLFDYKGFIKADLVFQGNSNEKRLSGKVYLSDGKVTYIGQTSIKKRSDDFISSLNIDEVEIIISNDLKASIGKDRLSFGEIVLKEGGHLKIKKKLDGLGNQNVQLEGILESKKGEFDYLGNTFKIIKSKIVFKRGINPRIEVTARSEQLRDENNRLVTVYLKINEDLNKLFEEQKKPQVDVNESILFKSLSSSPSKSPTEIGLLLGVSSGSEDRNPNRDNLNRAIAGKTADTAINLTIIKPIERKLKEVFGIDTFNIRQKFMQNTLFTDTPSESYGSFDSSTQQASGSEINPLRNTEITIGKNLMDNLYLRGGVIFLQDTHPGRDSSTKKTWKVGLETDLLPLLGIESETIKVQLGTEYQLKPDELISEEQSEWILKFEINIEF
ncbi:MAG: translocation/assembly module TamB domain-containing protein, partial [Spirochaetota bacterium]|nr:translocation/assembly module TamB domain-containing protein [Spirochaetota bacterium]